MKFIRRIILLVIVLGAAASAYVISKVKVETNVVMPELPTFDFFKEDPTAISPLPPPVKKMEEEVMEEENKIDCVNVNL